MTNPFEIRLYNVHAAAPTLITSQIVISEAASLDTVSLRLIRFGKEYAHRSPRHDGCLPDVSRSIERAWYQNNSGQDNQAWRHVGNAVYHMTKLVSTPLEIWLSPLVSGLNSVDLASCQDGENLLSNDILTVTVSDSVYPMHG